MLNGAAPGGMRDRCENNGNPSPDRQEGAVSTDCLNRSLTVAARFFDALWRRVKRAVKIPRSSPVKDKRRGCLCRNLPSTLLQGHQPRVLCENAVPLQRGLIRGCRAAMDGSLEFAKCLDAAAS